MILLNWAVLHLSADERGVTRVDPHFIQELAEVEFAPPAPPMLVSRAASARSLAMVELLVGRQGGWHPSPTKQWVICLADEMGYQAEDGTEFILRPGACTLTIETRGRGHNSWNAGAVPVRLVLIQVQ